MNTDDFEQRLREKAFRPVPPEWRESILETARQASINGPLPAVSSFRAAHRSVAAWWRNWLQPWPTAWTGIAACWAMIVALNLAAQPGASEGADLRAGARAAEAYLSMLRQPWQADLIPEPSPHAPAESRPPRMPPQGDNRAPQHSNLA